MEQYKQEFIEFMVESNVLRFGDFITKSGRKTPFFINVVSDSSFKTAPAFLLQAARHEMHDILLPRI